MKNLLVVLLFFSMTSAPVLADDFDPIEDVNRVTYSFNELFDDTIFEPLSRAYKRYIPEFAQTGVRNFFGNLRDVQTLANQIIQLKPIDSANTLGRIIVNTSIGVGGLFDVSSSLGLTTNDEDFGQTMAVWGVPAGPYVVLPFLGPSTLRDSIGIFVDISSDANMINKMDGNEFITANTLSTIDKRVELLPTTDLFDQSDDPYIAMRSSYLQNRRFEIFDGNPPIDDF
ncbi:MAG: VacJ family lipoprotein [Gammaproteobacteria bacterium]|nr:VacJ family lipoprotein [Gammaproteobacteria bacterium]